MIFKDYYKILEIETNKVSIQQIKSAYRELAKKYHPDVNVGNDKIEERFKDINEAYKVLSEDATRKKYDRMWNTYIGNKKKKYYEESKRESGSISSEFFNMFFGNIKQKTETIFENNKTNIPVKGENIETGISISIQEAFYGTEKEIALRTVEGKMKRFLIKVPAGIRKNEKIRLIGEGKNGKNGGNNGDLFIKINIQDNKILKLNGVDIETKLPITPWEAALGTKAKVQTVDEEAVVYIPQGIQSGEKIKISGKGYKDGKGGRGDLIAEINIMVPRLLTDEERELFEKLNEVSTFKPKSI